MRDARSSRFHFDFFSSVQDTQYLFEIKEKLTKMLIREKRMELFNKSMQVIPVLVDMEIAGFKLNTFEH